MKRFITWFRAQTPTVQAMLVLMVLLLLGILLRWDAVMEGIRKGFSFYSKKM